MARRRTGPKVPVDAAVRALCLRVLPHVIAHRRAFRHRSGLVRAGERLLFASVGLAGLHLWGWPPLFALVSIALSLWISLGADLYVMLRLRGAGVARFTCFQDLDRFVTEVLAAHPAATPAASGSGTTTAPGIYRSSIPDPALGPDQGAVDAPGSRLGVGLGHAAMGIGLLVLIIMVPREAPMPPMLGVHLDAWLTAAVAAGLQLWNEVHALRATPAHGDPILDWRLERGRLHGELRLFGLFIIHGLLVLTVVDPRHAGEPLHLVLLAILFYACIDIVFLQPAYRRRTEGLEALGARLAATRDGG